jgi:hypothetical protein
MPIVIDDTDDWTYVGTTGDGDSPGTIADLIEWLGGHDPAELISSMTVVFADGTEIKAETCR